MGELVSQLVKDTKYDGFLLVRSAELRASSNGSKYLDMTLGDRTGDINAKLWDGSVPVPRSGSVVRVRALVHEYNGRLQLRVERIREAMPDEVPAENLVPCAPEDPEKMLRELTDAAARLRPEGLSKLVLRLLREDRAALLYYPAASRLHHAERGGLLHHTTSMLRMAAHYADEYPTLDRSLLFAGVIVHDLAKIGELDANEMGVVGEYTADGMLIGHLVRGIVRIDRVGREEGCPGEVLMMLEHMVLAHHGVPEYGSPKTPMFPEAEVLHHLDVVDARIYEMNAAISRVAPGKFTERLWSLDRRLYSRVGGPEEGADDAK